MRKIIALGAAALLATGMSGLDAQSINFNYDTKGCFGVGCTPTTIAEWTSAAVIGNDPIIRFTGVTGEDDNSTGFGSNTVGFNLGTFELFAPPEAQGSATLSFTLLTALNQPDVNGETDTRVATVDGEVNYVTEAGQATISFADVWRTYSYTQGDWSGSFDFRVDPETIVNVDDTDGAETLGGQGIVRVPEPTSMALLGLGLFGIMGVASRRRREDEE